MLSESTTLNIGCAINLNKVAFQPGVTTLAFANADVYYFGGPIPDKRYFFYKCRFHFEQVGVPSHPAQEVLRTVLMADLNVPVKVSATS